MIESLQSGTVNVGRRADSLETSEQLAGYSRVTIKSGDASYTAGNDSGRVLSLECPWGTQEMANDILSKVMGVIYQPYKTTGAIADPAAELGDAVDVGDTHGGIYMSSTKFGSLITSDLSAPAGNETEHEYVYTPKKERQVARTLSLHAGSIGAMSKKIEDIRIDITECIADIGDVRSGLYAIASADDIKGFKDAKTTLFATISDDISTVSADLVLISNRTEELETASAKLSTRVDGAEASITLNAQNINGVASSMATIQADVVELKGRVNLTDTAYVTEGHGLGVKGSIVGNGNLLVSGYIGTTANGPIMLAGKNFTPTEITSTSGTVLVLGTA